MRSSGILELGTLTANRADSRREPHGTPAAQRFAMRHLILASLVLAGCKADDLLSDLPDASPDVDSTVLPPDGEWSCLDEDWPISPAGEITITGVVADNFGTGIGGAAIEILDADDGTVLGTGTTSSLPQTRGKYAVAITVDGTATRLLRKATALGRLDAYQLDPAPISVRFLDGEVPINSLTPEQADGFYGSLLGDPDARDPAKGDGFIDFFDCDGARVGGATIEIDGAAAIAYTDEEGLVGAGTGQTETSAEFGSASAFGLDPGDREITIHIGELALPPVTLPIVADGVVGARWYP